MLTGYSHWFRLDLLCVLGLRFCNMGALSLAYGVKEYISFLLSGITSLISSVGNLVDLINLFGNNFVSLISRVWWFDRVSISVKSVFLNR